MDSLQEVLAWLDGNEQLVYGLLFLYSALKSGALPFYAALAAAAGGLDLVAVSVASFLGGYLGDELRFAVARRYTGKISFKNARLQRGLRVAIALMEAYGPRYIFLYRYPKGMRTIGAFPVGLSTMPWREFTVLNAASALLWVIILVGGGYLFGQQVGDLVQNGWGTVSVLLLLAMVGLAWVGYLRMKTIIATV